ncbi:MAG: DUF4097 family beta strand repeat protein [Deltaproteobacteria bacterium]|nr:DUF4097 family beta strand repeat protein [Deltaproteobacteria bacterium]
MIRHPSRNGWWTSVVLGIVAGCTWFGTVSAAGDGGPLPTTPTTPGRPIDAREVIVPVPGAERMRIDNPLGSVTIRSWQRTDAVHIIAEKSSSSPEALARLRVHFTAWAGGEISVETRVEMGGRERALPLVASRVDLVVEVPASMEIEAKTFAGDLSASGLRAGARLETTGGRIGISDVHGRIVTRQLRGGQTVVAVDGDVDLDGVEGHMRLEGIAGARVEARVVDGDIRAENIQSNEVRLSATTGEVILLGFLRPRAHYDLRSYSGEVRLALVAVPPGAAASGFELRVRSPSPVESAIPLRPVWRQGDRLRAIATPAGARLSPGVAVDRPVVELSSVLGRVVLTAARAFDGAPRGGADMRTGGASSPF